MESIGLPLCVKIQYICNGETVAGLRDNATGKFIEDMLITSDLDVDLFNRNMVL